MSKPRSLGPILAIGNLCHLVDLNGLLGKLVPLSLRGPYGL
ncbi:MAG: hypothetical protein QXI39_06620 [Candidatus Bathyarchaeia archaeon]